MPKAVLLVNLGSPRSPSVPDVRRYLREFLMDGRVLDVNPVLRFCIVHFLILPFRPRRSARAYKSIWTSEGSPLIVNSRKVRQALASRVNFPVELAMRYQEPSIAGALESLANKGADDVLLIPLFPHYAMSSYETAVARVEKLAAKLAPGMRIRVQPPYYANPDYVAALVLSAEQHLKSGYDHILFSFHGIPERQIRKSDPTPGHCLVVPDCCNVESGAHATCYRAQCFKTVREFVRVAGIPPEKYSISFQSRLGRTPWLRPYTDHELIRLPSTGVKKLLVICPSFVSDCLETLEEIGIRGRKSFLDSGGTDFAQVPCLNDHPAWIGALERMAQL